MRLRLLALTIFVLTPGVAAAQLAGTAMSVGQSAYTISVHPQFPSPNSQAAISFISDTLDLSGATLAVTVAGKKIYDGSVKPVSIPLGKAGVPVTASVTLTANGTKYTQSVTVRPQDVSLVVEPVSSAPPLYPGKPAVPLEGDVRVVAVANLKSALGKAVDPATVSYSWTVDGTQIANSSGIGKQALLVASPLQYRNRDVSVVVRSADGTMVGGDSISLAPQEPSVRIYENDPLLGIRYERALSGNYTITGAESTLYAAVFSLPTSSGAPFLQWLLDGALAQTGSSITLRPTGSGGGSASLSVTASGGSYSTATDSLSLTFGKTGGSNFFGL